MRSVTIRLFYTLLSLSLMLALTGTQTAYAAGIVVNSSADNTTDDGQCTLREAITNANNNAATHPDCTAGSGDDVITFNLSGCPCTITLTLGELNIASNITITGSGASNLIISGGNVSTVISVGSATLNLSQVTITGGATTPGGSGGGIYISGSGVANISQSAISGNSADFGAGIYSSGGTLTLLNSTISNNTAGNSGGGIYANNSGNPPITTMTNTTITGNSATNDGMAIINGGPMTIRNSTIAKNNAGGGTNGIFYAGAGSISLWNTIVANTTCNSDLTNGGNNIDSGVTCGFGSANGSQSSTDPLLGILTGSPAYFRLNVGSPAINAGDDTVCAAAPVNNTSQNGVTRPAGTHCEIGAYEYLPVADNVQLSIGETLMGNYGVATGSNTRPSYAGVNNGPVKALGMNALPIIASERVAYTPDGGTTWTSFDEMMGLPSNQLTDTYYFPYYNNVEMNTQLRFGNVGTSNTVVTVTIGGIVQGSYFVIPNQSMRLSYNLNSGPVKVQSSGNVPIIASIRFANIQSTSPLVVPAFTEMMGLPGNQLTSTYIFPYYNNVEMNTQLRFGNVGTSATNVTVTIGGVVQGVYPVAPSQSVRLFYNLNSGPVKVQSSGNVPIIASMRFANIESESPLVISYFSEMLGLPQASLSTNYWFPIYDNVTHNMQLRFGNMGSTSTTVTVRVGGTDQGSYVVLPNQSQRLFYTLNDGPVQVESSGGVPIIASIRFAYIESEAPLVIGAFSEMLGLPAAQLSSTYLFPWYNNDELNTQMRIAVP